MSNDTSKYAPEIIEAAERFDVPITALVDHEIEDCPRSIYVVCPHDRDGWAHETEAEYRDMCAMRSLRDRDRSNARIGEVRPDWNEGHPLLLDEGHPMSMLAYWDGKIHEAREWLVQREIDAWNEAHPLTEDGDQPAYLMTPFTKADLHTPDFGLNEGHPVYETPLQQRDSVRLPYLLKTIEDAHDADHEMDQRHPFCGECRAGGSWSAGSSLAWWLAGHPGETPPRGEHRIDVPTTKKVYLKYGDLAEFPEPTWLIPNLVPDASVGYLMGRDGTYKTFLALWFTMHLIRQGKPVLFIAGEGVRSFRKRIDAWLEHHGVEMTPEMIECLDIRAQTVDLFEAGEDYRDMVRLAEKRQYALIVVDTLARSSGAAEQNSNSDMNVVTQRIDRLKHKSGATVLVVAHTDKGDNGIRGASAIGDNGDFRLLMKRKDDDVTLSIDKMKDADDDFTKRLSVKEVGESIVLVPADEKPVEVEGSHSNRNRTIVAFARLQALGFISQSQARKTTDEDGSGKDALNDGTFSRMVADLVSEGVLERNGTAKEWRLNAAHPDAQRALDYVPTMKGLGQ